MAAELADNAWHPNPLLLFEYGFYCLSVAVWRSSKTRCYRTGLWERNAGETPFHYVRCVSS